ncbi:MAG TPA: signal peptidase II [Gemmatimonadales bacterium]|jgi:signal peptidase II
MTAVAMSPKLRGFWWSVVPLLAADRISKALAFEALQPAGVPRRVLGNAVRLTLVFNQDAAMNLSLGAWSRWGFAAIATVGVILLMRILAATPRSQWQRGAAVGLVVAGAVGNLLDRIRWDRGVVDFLDVGVGVHRFWTFNVADIGVTIGAVLLVLSFSRETSPGDDQLVA